MSKDIVFDAENKHLSRWTGPENNKSRDERRCCKLDVTEIAPLHLTGSRHGTPTDSTLL